MFGQFISWTIVKLWLIWKKFTTISWLLTCTFALKETIKTSDKPEKENVEEDALNDEAILDIYLDMANDQSEIEEIVSVESALEDIVNDESIFTAFPV